MKKDQGISPAKKPSRDYNKKITVLRPFKMGKLDKKKHSGTTITSGTYWAKETSVVKRDGKKRIHAYSIAIKETGKEKEIVLTTATIVTKKKFMRIE